MYLEIVHPTLVKPLLNRVPMMEEEVEAIVENQAAQGFAHNRGESYPACFRLPG